MNEDRSEEYKLLLAEIGDTVLSAGGIDHGLVFLLGAILAPVPSAGHSAELASVFVYAARSFDQRIEIVNGAFHARFYLELRAHKHDNRRRSIEFITKAKEKVFSSLGAHIWIRNFAAHGSVSLAGNEPMLIPGIYDYQSRLKLSKRGGETGLTVEKIRQHAALLNADLQHLTSLAIVMADFIQWFHVMPQKFLESVNRLAGELSMPKLTLRDPNAGPPLRQRRPKKEKRSASPKRP